MMTDRPMTSVKFLGGRHVPLPAVAEVADNGLAQPGEEAWGHVPGQGRRKR